MDVDGRRDPDAALVIISQSVSPEVLPPLNVMLLTSSKALLSRSCRRLYVILSQAVHADNSASRRSSSSVNFGETFLPENYVRKITKMPEFLWYLPENISEFYMIIARKIFFQNFWVHVPPVCYAYGGSSSLSCRTPASCRDMNIMKGNGRSMSLLYLRQRPCSGPYT